MLLQAQHFHLTSYKHSWLVNEGHPSTQFSINDFSPPIHSLSQFPYYEATWRITSPLPLEEELKNSRTQDNDPVRSWPRPLVLESRALTSRPLCFLLINPLHPNISMHIHHTFSIHFLRFWKENLTELIM